MKLNKTPEYYLFRAEEVRTLAIAMSLEGQRLMEVIAQDYERLAMDYASMEYCVKAINEAEAA